MVTTRGQFLPDARTLRAKVGAALILVIAIGGSTVLWAQGGLPASTLAAPADVEPANSVRLLVGRSTVVDAGSAISRVSLTSADVADALVTSPNQLLVHGKQPGTISMFVWNKAGSLRRYEVTVERDLARLGEQLKLLFPGEKIEATSNGRNIVLAGGVSSKDIIEKAINVATGYVDKRDEVVTLMQLRGDAPSNQVLLRVRFAEVSRSALTELGASLFTSPTGVRNTIGRTSTQQFAAPGFSDLEYTKSSSDFGGDVTSASGSFTFSDFLNMFFFSQKYDLGAMIKLLQTKGSFQSLAEPNLVAESGKEASFLAGGEIPIPVAQGSGANMAVSVMFKEFGIRLNFTPVVNGNRIHLKVRPEVSTLDFGNAVVLNGFRIPALSTRRAETEIELENGQTFAIAGLMNNTVSQTMQKIPGIGDIPILGYLFKSKAAQKNQTELVVMITPEILTNNSRGVTPNLPRTPEPFMAPLPDDKTVAPKAPAFGGASSSPALAVAPPVSAPVPVTSVAPAATATPAAPANVPASKPMSAAEIKKAEKEREAANKAAQKAQAQDLQRQEKAAKEQLKKDQEQAKKDAEAAKKAEEAAKKADQQKAKEKDTKRQSSIELDPGPAPDVAARLKAAEAAYAAEVAKKSSQQ
jgi:pilus assembly protein CpaC